MRNVLAEFAFTALALTVIASCGSSDADGGTDAGGLDAGRVDSGRVDSGGVDSGGGDAGGDAGNCVAPRVLCNGTCTDPTTDVANCGTCGHACGCGAASCSAGTCDPVVLADKQGGPVALTQFGGKLYWGADTDRTLSSVSVDGGQVAPLYPGRTVIRGIVAHATSLFFTRTAFNIIESGPIGGGGGGNYTNTREPGSMGIAIDDTRVYWANWGDSEPDGAIRTTAFAAPRSPTTLIGGQRHPTSVLVDANNVYWTTNVLGTGTVMRMPKAGGAATAIASNQAAPYGLAMDANNVYWANQGGTGVEGSVNMAPIASTGNAITPIATGGSPYNVAVDAQFVYWTDLRTGTVQKAPLAGGAATRLAVNQAQPMGLALDASCVYFTVFASGTAAAGSIRKLAK